LFVLAEESFLFYDRIFFPHNQIHELCRMGLAQDARSKQVNTSVFWHIILPVLVLMILLFILFVIFTMPDWALTCTSSLESLRRRVESGTVE